MTENNHKGHLTRCAVGVCTLCGKEWEWGEGVAGYVPVTEFTVRGIGICNKCLELIRQGESGNAYFKGEIKIKCQTPDELTKEQIKDMVRQVTEKSTNKHKHLLEDLFADVHVSFKTDLEPMTEVRRLRKLVEVERSARGDLKRLEEQFADDPLLLGIYSSTAQYTLDQVTRTIDEIFDDLLGEGNE